MQTENQDKIQIFLRNDGNKIVETNYFESELARRGMMYASFNAGHLRLLIPAAQGVIVSEIMNSDIRYVVVSAGKMDSRDALEIMFEDFTDSPYCLYIDRQACDRYPAQDFQHHESTMFLFFNGTLLPVSFYARFRFVDKLPCVCAWDGPKNFLLVKD